MGTLRTNFGRRLRYLRRQRDLTQEQLAEAAEVSVDFVSMVERGINAPSFSNIERFAESLEIPVYELFLFDEGES